MKKKLLLVVSIVALLVCLFAITVSAETALKPQTTNAYGELSFFDESISVGRTNAANGFTPYIDETGTTYARIVVGDGTTFYTFPTAYALSNTSLWGDSTKCIMVLDLTSLNSAMQAVTNTNPNWGKANIYRIELPAHMQYLNADNQNFNRCTNLIEIYLQPNTTTKDTGKTMLFWKCNNLETIHNLDTFVFKKGCLGGSFQECKKLTNLTIGVSPDVTDTGDNFLNGCTGLVSINFAEAFPNLTTIGKSCFANCTSLESFTIPNTVETISQYAFQRAGVKSIVIPDSVTSIGQRAFQFCPNLETAHFATTNHDVSIGDNLFGTDNNNATNTTLKTVTFEKNSGIKNIGVYMFYRCAALESLSMPDSVTYIGSQAFLGCTSLGPLHLSNSLTSFHNSDIFEDCNNMYFVSEFFEDASKVVKEDVYYFPNIIETLSLELFKYCNNLNQTIVFGDKLTSITNGYSFARKNATTTQNIVFLGNMTNLTTCGESYKINFYFCGKTTADQITISTSQKGECYAYICSSGVYGPLNGITNQMTNASHLQEKIVETPATCTLNEGTHKLCFCGFVMESTDKEGGEKALGHTSEGATVVMYFPLLNGAPNYFADAHNKYNCPRCNEEQDEVAEGTALFVGDRGYSYEEAGTSVLYRLHVNVDNIKAYSGAFRYGIIVSGAPSTAPITLVDGAITYGEKALVFEMQSANYAFDYIQAKVTNIGEAELNCQAYAIDNNVVTYIGHNNVNTLAEIVTYDAIVEAYGTTSGETKEN